MNSKRILSEIRDELDSRQIVVSLQETPFGVQVSGDYPSVVITKAELRRRGIQVLD